jgi:hypothetical protein
MTRSERSRPWVAANLVTGCAIATVSVAGIGASAQWRSAPRFDGAGYAVLAQALRNGQGYRAMDHPDAPLHAHFPPGYPCALALVWRVTGVSDLAAHFFSCLCTVGATLATWLWFRRIESARAAFLLGMALAANWLWLRTGSAIQSEPLYLLLGQLTIIVAARSADRPEIRPTRLCLLSLLSAWCLLTRHVAVGLVAAIVLDLALRGRPKDAFLIAFLTAILVSPWIGWVAKVGSSGTSQAALLARSGDGWLERLGHQAAFYVERIPDQITGPFVEVATRFGSSRWTAVAARLWAVLATGVIATEWLRALRRPRRRLAGLVPFITLSMLIVWPYTEAGRFLIPLVPFILLGAVDGLSRVLRLLGRSIGASFRSSRLRNFAACLVLAASLPYSGYTLVTGRSRAVEASQRDFDAACAWISGRATPPGPVLSRHPGEVFLRTGRQGLEVSSSERTGDRDADPESIDRTITRYGVAYLLIDKERYAESPKSPLEHYVARYPDRIRWVWGAENGSVAVYEVGWGRSASPD